MQVWAIIKIDQLAGATLGHSIRDIEREKTAYWKFKEIQRLRLSLSTMIFIYPPGCQPTQQQCPVPAWPSPTRPWPQHGSWWPWPCSACPAPPLQCGTLAGTWWTETRAATPRWSYRYVKVIGWLIDWLIFYFFLSQENVHLSYFLVVPSFFR